jgi:hypothetical protein
MTDFRPDCTINLHVELRGKPAKLAWACSITHPRRGRLVLARKFVGVVPREEAEISALLFGLRQASRFLQEKVEVAASFSVDRLLAGGESARAAPEVRAIREEAKRRWEEFRLRRSGSLTPLEAVALRAEAERSYRSRKG